MERAGGKKYSFFFAFFFWGGGMVGFGMRWWVIGAGRRKGRGLGGFPPLGVDKLLVKIH